jgi:hypothetical protein
MCVCVCVCVCLCVFVCVCVCVCACILPMIIQIYSLFVMMYMKIFMPHSLIYYQICISLSVLNAFKVLIISDKVYKIL